MDLKEIKSLIDLMKKNDLSVFELEKEGFRISLKKELAYQPVTAPVPHAAAAPPAPGGAPAAETPKSNLKEIVSPMVGTFYLSSSPESPPYVEIGKEVAADTVVCIIEAMKVMNEIKAEVSGVVAEVMAENGKAVQFGQPLFRLK